MRGISTGGMFLICVGLVWCLGCVHGTLPAHEEEMKGFIYVVNEDEDTVSVIDATTNSVVAALAVGAWPHYASVSPDGKKVYISNGDGNSISVIDVAKNQVVSTIQLREEGKPGDPQEIAVDPQGRFAYVPMFDSDEVIVVDLTSKVVVTSIPVGEAPVSISMSRDGKRCYVVCIHNPESSVIDIATNRVIATFHSGEGATGIDVSLDGRYLYLGGHGVGMWKAMGEKNKDIRKIDTTTFEQLALIKCGIMPIGVRFSPDGTFAAVISHGSGDLHIIDSQTEETTRIKVGNNCYGVTISADGRWIYVTNKDDDSSSVVDAIAKKVIATIPVGHGPKGVATTVGG
ncbi:cytochrome D1 domain-containing protein [Chloroflexota bacterium]